MRKIMRKGVNPDECNHRKITDRLILWYEFDHDKKFCSVNDLTKQKYPHMKTVTEIQTMPLNSFGEGY